MKRKSRNGKSFDYFDKIILWLFEVFVVLIVNNDDIY